MKTLLNKINIYYKRYDMAHPFDNIKLTKADMYDLDALMTVYEDIWTTTEYHESATSTEYLWIIALYGELRDYIDSVSHRSITPYKWQSQTMGNIVCTFGEVVRQAWNSLIYYHTLDLRWSYNKRGF